MPFASRAPDMYPAKRTSSPARNHRERAMTLLELMVVVAIVGILAALGVAGYQAFLRSAPEDEEKQTLLGIVQGVDDFFKRTGGYLDCSDGWTDYYPLPPSDKKRLLTDPAHPDFPCWNLYGFDATPSYMALTIRAGTAADVPPAPPTKTAVTYPDTIREPWFVLVATTDRDGDGELGYFVVTSFAPNQIIVENGSE